MISNEMKDEVLHIYWNDRKHTLIFPLNELYSVNTTNEVIKNYHRLATLELRKQKLNKL